MAAKAFASRLKGSRVFLRGFVVGAAVGAAGGGLTALQLFRGQDAEAAWAGREPDGECGHPGPDRSGGHPAGMGALRVSASSSRAPAQLGGSARTWHLASPQVS